MFLLYFILFYFGLKLCSQSCSRHTCPYGFLPRHLLPSLTSMSLTLTLSPVVPQAADFRDLRQQLAVVGWRRRRRRSAGRRQEERERHQKTNNTVDAVHTHTNTSTWTYSHTPSVKVAQQLSFHRTISTQRPSTLDYSQIQSFIIFNNNILNKYLQ